MKSASTLLHSGDRSWECSIVPEATFIPTWDTCANVLAIGLATIAADKGPFLDEGERLALRVGFGDTATNNDDLREHLAKETYTHEGIAEPSLE